MQGFSKTELARQGSYGYSESRFNLDLDGQYYAAPNFGGRSLQEQYHMHTVVDAD